MEAMMTLHYVNIKSIWKLINVLLHNGWNVYAENNQIHYISNCNGMFEWEMVDYTIDDLKSNIVQKEANNEQIGITLYFNNDVGIDLLVHDTESIVVSSSVNRVLIDSDIYRHSDVTWYLKNIIIPLENEGIVAQRIEWCEIND